MFICLNLDLAELNELKDSLKNKVTKEAEYSVGGNKLQKIRKDIKMENDIKLRQKKKEIMVSSEEVMNEFGNSKILIRLIL